MILDDSLVVKERAVERQEGIGFGAVMGRAARCVVYAGGGGQGPGE